MTDPEVHTRKKLIEVALPLEAINAASAREKSIRHGHPSTLHLWWARRPLAAARAVIFAQMVDDPSSRPELFPTEEAQDAERQRLFRIIERLVLWENTTNEAVLDAAREEIRKSWRLTCEDNRDHPRAAELFNPDRLPAFHDPFAGGGALPLEAQRLGLEAHASDLNPVAVLINKAMIEIPPKFAAKPPVNPESRERLGQAAEWKGAAGLADDVRYYGKWMRDEAERRIGHLYPKVEVTEEMARERPDLKQYVGKKLTVIAWLWARTVKSPNPAFSNVDVPLVASFMLSTKSGREAYVEPVIENGGYRFTVKVGKPSDLDAAKTGTKLSRGSFRCLLSGVPMRYIYIDDEANAGRMSERLMAVVAEGNRGRAYLPPLPNHEETARSAQPHWKPDAPSRGTWASNAQGRYYGFHTFGDYFTPRQLVALTTFSDLVGEARERIRQDAIDAGLPNDATPLRDSGTGATAYAEAVSVYLALGVDRLSDRSSTICSWDAGYTKIRNTFGRQAIPMTWDYAEGNPFSASTGNFSSLLEWIEKCLVQAPATPPSFGTQRDAAHPSIGREPIVSTDPPYYDNIGYADLSDFFYVWLRRSLRQTYPDIFSTLAVPKSEELVATPYRHGSKEKAEQFFLEGMTLAMQRLSDRSHPAFPVTIYYAFKQSETRRNGMVTRTGWETFLDAVMRAGFAMSGTWPMRTELSNRMIGSGANALASSIVLVCRKSSETSFMASRGEFLGALRHELGEAVRTLQSGSIGSVDLPQSCIGPGMEIFTRYSRVLEADGSQMTVGAALAAINQVLDEVLAEQEGEYDAATRWAISWFEQYGLREGDFGDADNLARARDTAVDALTRAGIVESGAGKVRLLKISDFTDEWNPPLGSRITIWEAAHRLILAHDSGGVDAAGRLADQLGGDVSDRCRKLADRLFSISDRKGWTELATSYNALGSAWGEVLSAAEHQRGPVQGQLQEV